MKTLSTSKGVVVLVVLIGVFTGSAPGQTTWISEAELEQVLAPIALYPDVLLSQILTAASYPLDVVQAARWSRAHPFLEGDQAVQAVAYEAWDPSVKALVGFPRILQQMSENLEWTRRLGEAVLSQEASVLAALQRLREQARFAGHLQSNAYMRVVTERPVIRIEPAYPRVVYVPVYDPWSVYGKGAWPAGGPVTWWSPPSHSVHGVFVWGPGISVSPAIFYNHVHWDRGTIIVRIGSYPSRTTSTPYEWYPYRSETRRWRHDPRSSPGKPYRDRDRHAAFPGRSVSDSRSLGRHDPQFAPAPMSTPGYRRRESTIRSPTEDPNAGRSRTELRSAWDRSRIGTASGLPVQSESVSFRASTSWRGSRTLQPPESEETLRGSRW